MAEDRFQNFHRCLGGVRCLVEEAVEAVGGALVPKARRR
ncbi:hypothetical protein GA0115245_112589 [Streptomyces sp. di188]|nr:hypothetical protein GA0115238_120090 [Streptomyces sp. di50b]SCD75975.1 hypothetical protein GA0115245_112589 [Streptomyces sp. di188]